MKCLEPFIGKERRVFGCGQCLPCRIQKRKLWTHRIMLEASGHVDNTFVTLTYAKLPAGGSVSVRDVQVFLKRLRWAYRDRTIRYFAVGEYGDRSWRPHYHVACFGLAPCRSHYVAPADFRYSNPEVLGGCACLSCSVVRKAWGLGHVMLGSLERKSAQYIAGYTVKKMTCVDDGRLAGREPEFARMSLRPGIGANALQELALAVQTHGLVRRLGDVPGALRHGSTVLPLGRYLRTRLRLLCGFPMRERVDRDGVVHETPVVPEVRVEEKLRLLWEYIDASVPGGVDKRALASGLIGEFNDQAARNMQARSLVSRRRI